MATRILTNEIQETLASQDLKEAYIVDASVASVTSLFGRIPTFEFNVIDGISYLRIKKDVVFA